jgi:ABC-type Na+ transport system ATPase subunit NatA
LIRERKVVILSEELKGLPLDKLEEIHRFIEEKKREGVEFVVGDL